MAMVHEGVDASVEFEEQFVMGEFDGQVVESSTRKRGRPSRVQSLHQDGPLVLAAIIGQSDGRWRAVAQSLGGQELRNLLDKRGGQSSDLNARPEILGFAVVTSWRSVNATFGSLEAHHMASSLVSLFPQRQGYRFLEHEFLDAVVVSPGMAKACNYDFAGQAVPAHICKRVLAAVMARDSRWTSLVVHAHSRWKDFVGRNFGDLLTEWFQYWKGLEKDNVIGWPLFYPLATAVVRGQWRHDVSTLFRRSGGVSERWVLAPVQPSVKLVREFLKQSVSAAMPNAPVDVLALPSGQSSGYLHTPKIKRGFVVSFTVETLLLSLRAARHLVDQEDYSVAMKDFATCIRAALPIDPSGTMMASLSRTIWPKKWTLRRHRVTLDIAAMLARRDMHVALGPAFRYLAFDASPQRPGIEVFATGERVVRRSTLQRAYHSGQLPTIDVEVRRLPLTVLGQGRASLSDKVAAHCHQCWLEYGGSLRSLREANVQVRGIISDCGTEIALGDHVDVLDDMYGHSSIGRLHGHLYPFALMVPGCQHLVDNLCHDSINSLPWWSEWSAESNIACQWLNDSSHRELLAEVWQQQATAANEKHTGEMVKSLQTSCDRFAHWRWRTLFNVTTDLVRLQPAVCGAMAYIEDRTILGTRDSAKREKFVAIVESDVFWSRAHALHMCMAPLFEFSSWLRGCPCHEQERKGKRVHNVVCNWAGCRAPELAAQLMGVGFKLQGLSKAPITRLARGQLDVADEGDIRVLYSAMYAGLELKFGWVNEAPYTIWQVDSPEAAKHFLDMYDGQIAQGEPVHRVSQYIAGDEVWSLRRDMEQYVATHRRSFRLWSELQAYQMCPVDETPIEAVHRDVTRIGVRATAGTIAYKAATMRSQQVWNEVDTFGGQFESRLRFWFPRINAITSFP